MRSLLVLDRLQLRDLEFAVSLVLGCFLIFQHLDVSFGLLEAGTSHVFGGAAIVKVTIPIQTCLQILVDLQRWQRHAVIP